jgi:glutathione peroxidase
MELLMALQTRFTRQFDGLEKLYQAYKGKGFVILGFPSNDFGAQDPGTNEEIATFCKANYGVTFPMFSKIVVKGEGQHPLYKWLTEKETDPNFAGPIGWNFTKFLVNKEGAVVARFESKVEPGSAEIKAAVEKEIG